MAYAEDTPTGKWTVVSDVVVEAGDEIVQRVIEGTVRYWRRDAQGREHPMQLTFVEKTADRVPFIVRQSDNDDT